MLIVGKENSPQKNNHHDIAREMRQSCVDVDHSMTGQWVGCRGFAPGAAVPKRAGMMHTAPLASEPMAPPVATSIGKIYMSMFCVSLSESALRLWVGIGYDETSWASWIVEAWTQKA